jgi:hypothetical protein
VVAARLDAMAATAAARERDAEELEAILLAPEPPPGYISLAITTDSSACEGGRDGGGVTLLLYPTLSVLVPAVCQGLTVRCR